jgi:tetratricopeptide (TPR) repeat protein
VGQLQRELGQLPDALAVTRQGCDLRLALARARPQDSQAQGAVARALTFLGELQAEAGRPAEAAVSFRQVRTIQEELLAERSRPSPQALALQGVLADTLHSLATQQARAGETAEAIRSLRRSCDLRAPLLRDGRDQESRRRRLSQAYADLARLYREMGQPAEAAAAAAERGRLWPGTAVELAEVARDLALCLALVGGSPTERQRYAEQALETLRQAVACGLRDFSCFATDPALEWLRQHPDFQALREQAR